MTALVSGIRGLFGKDHSRGYSSEKRAERVPADPGSSTAKVASVTQLPETRGTVYIYKVSMPKTIDELNGYVLSTYHFQQLLQECKNSDTRRTLLRAQELLTQIRSSKDSGRISLLTAQVEQCLASAQKSEAEMALRPRTVRPQQRNITLDEMQRDVRTVIELDRIIQEQLALRNAEPTEEEVEAEDFEYSPPAESFAEVPRAYSAPSAPVEAYREVPALKLPMNISEFRHFAEHPDDFALLLAQCKQDRSRVQLQQAMDWLKACDQNNDQSDTSDLKLDIGCNLRMTLRREGVIQ